MLSHGNAFAVDSSAAFEFESSVDAFESSVAVAVALVAGSSDVGVPSVDAFEYTIVPASTVAVAAAVDAFE